MFFNLKQSSLSFNSKPITNILSILLKMFSYSKNNLKHLAQQVKQYIDFFFNFKFSKT